MAGRFHEGELEVQRLAGEAERAAQTGRALGTRIPSVARRFLEAQSTFAVAWQAPDGDLWCAFRVAAAGFAESIEEGAGLKLELFPDRAPPLQSPPLAVQAGDRLGLLFIDLAARHRLRVNGRVRSFAGSGLVLDVAEAFPNCLKYIQAREQLVEPVAADGGDREAGSGSPADLARWLERADTAFVATGHPGGHLDCSHRGGKPGFIGLEGSDLSIPDYPGNSMFATLGNLAVDPRAGLCLVDFEEGRLLHLTGEVRLELRRQADLAATGGTGRWWTFTPRRWVAGTLPGGGWRLLARSPYSP
jgi:uncharacterized protein